MTSTSNQGAGVPEGAAGPPAEEAPAVLPFGCGGCPHFTFSYGCQGCA
jgi:hypothetical protein